jgi:hypothetical protein
MGNDCGCSDFASCVEKCGDRSLDAREGQAGGDLVELVAESHELKTPEPDRRPQLERVVGICHLERWRELGVFHVTIPYLVLQLSVFGPWVLNQLVNVSCGRL